MAAQRVTFQDGREIEVDSGFGDLLAWEVHALETGMPTTAGLNAAAYMAFSAARRAGLVETGMPFSAWITGVAGIKDADAGAEAEAAASPDPTRPGPGTGSPRKRRSDRGSATST